MLITYLFLADLNTLCHKMLLLASMVIYCNAIGWGKHTQKQVFILRLTMEKTIEKILKWISVCSILWFWIEEDTFHIKKPVSRSAWSQSWHCLFECDCVDCIVYWPRFSRFSRKGRGTSVWVSVASVAFWNLSLFLLSLVLFWSRKLSAIIFLVCFDTYRMSLSEEACN